MASLTKKQSDSLLATKLEFTTFPTMGNGFHGTSFSFKTRRKAEKASRAIFGDVSPISKFGNESFGFSIY